MLPTEPRRLVILTEGHSASTTPRPRWASSATARTTSSRSSIRRWPGGTWASHARSRHPVRRTLSEALAGPIRPDGLLIGIAPTGGKLPRAWRSIDPRGDRRRARHPLGAARVPRRRPRVRRRSRAAGTRLDRLPAATRPDGDDRRPAAPAGQAGDPDGRRPIARSARCRSPSSWSRPPGATAHRR